MHTHTQTQNCCTK